MPSAARPWSATSTGWARVLSSLVFLVACRPSSATAPEVPDAVEPTTSPAPEATSSAVTRLGTTRWRMDDSVQSIAFTPDGTTVVAASQRGGLVTFERATGQRRLHIPVDGDVYDMVLLDEGRTIAVAGGGGIARYAVETGEPLDPLLASDSTITTMVIDPRATVVATLAGEGPVRVLDVATGKELARFGEGNDFADLAFVPGTPWLAAALRDRVGLWNWRTGTREHQLPTSQAGEFGVAADGSWIAVVGYGNGWEVYVWSLLDGKKVATLTVEGTGTIASSADGQLLLTNEGDAVSVWDVGRGQRIQRLAPTSDYARSIALSTDGTVVAAGGNDNAIGLWRLADGARLTENLGHRGRVHSLGFSHDGDTLFTTSLGDQTALMWSVPDRDPVLALPGRHAALDSTGRQLFAARSGDVDMETLVARGVGDEESRTWEASLGLIRGMRVQPDGLLAVAEGGRISLVAPGAPGPTWSSEALEGGEDRFSRDASVGFSSDGTTAVLYAGTMWMTVDLVERTVGPRIDLMCPSVRGAAVSRDGEAVVTGDDAGRVWLWRAGGRVASVQASDHIEAVAIDGAASLVAYATSAEVVLWDPTQALQWRHERFRPSVLDFSRAGDRLAVGFENGTIEIWNRAQLLRTTTPKPAPPAIADDPCTDDEDGQTAMMVGFLNASGPAAQRSLYEGMFIAPAPSE
ncbi:MAG: PQQ-binding-like beta-propeller repeat protein [Deltaproteobacteria bacterium]|nr:PQQ-binding-like beta-propeller repeat protein [Deltaproteobacteria bacterium]